MTALELQQTLTSFIPVLWHLNQPEAETEIEIQSGDQVTYFDDDRKAYATGTYINLWQHHHTTETSPFYRDTRTMAYIRTTTGATYADIETIKLAEETLSSQAVA